MKRCTYCGHENEDDLAHCRGCGCGEFNPNSPVGMPEAENAAEPVPETPEAAIGVDKGPLITRIICRTPLEADLVISELESVDIIGIVPNEIVEEACVIYVADQQVPVLVSTKAYEAAREIHSAIDPTVIANTPLPWATRCVIMFLPILTCFGVLMFFLLLASYTEHGQERRAEQARLWFALGFVSWLFAGVLVWGALAALR